MNGSAEIRRSFRDYCTLLIGQGGVIACTILNSILMTRVLGAAGYGHVAVFLMVTQVIVNTMASWLTPAITRYGCEELVQHQSLRRTVGARIALLSPILLVSLAGLVIGHGALQRYLGMPAWGVVLVGIAMVGMTVATTIQSLLQASQRMSGYAWVAVAEKATVLVGLLLLTAGVSWIHPLGGCVLLLAIGSWVSALVGMSRLKDVAWWPPAIDRVWLLRTLRFSAPFLISMVGVTVTTWADIALTNQFLPKEQLGVYSLARQIVTMLKQGEVLGGVLVVPLIFNWMATQQQARINRYVYRLLPLAVLVWCSVLALGLPVLWGVLPLIWGHDFASAQWPMALLMIEAGVSAWYYWGVPILSAYEASGQITITSLVAGVIVPTLGWFAIPRWGIAGSAAAVLGASVMTQVLLLDYVNRRARVAWILCAMAVLPVILSAGLCWWLGPWFALAGTLVLLAVFSSWLWRRRALLNDEDVMLLKTIELPEWGRWMVGRLQWIMARVAPTTSVR